MREQRHNTLENLNYDSIEIACFFCLCCGKKDTFLPPKVTARGQYVSLLHQAKYECVNIYYFLLNRIY